MLNENRKMLLGILSVIAGMTVLSVGVYRTYFYSVPDVKLLGGLVLAVTVVFCILIVLMILFQKKLAIHWNGLVLTIILGCIYTFIMPPFSCPDENRHINTVFQSSNTLLGVDTDGGTNEYLNLRKTELEAYEHLFGVVSGQPENSIPNMSTHRSLYVDLTKETDNIYIRVPNLQCLKIPFWSYAPQIVGVTVARLLSLNGAMTLIAGRLFSVLFYALMISYSIYITPVGKEVFAVASLLPMSMELAASFSYDAFTIAISYVAIAYLLFLNTETAKVGYKELACLSCILALIAPVKIIYVFIGLIYFAVPNEKFRSRTWKFLSILIPLLMGFCLIVFYRSSHIAFVIKSTGFVEGMKTYALSDFFFRPLNVLKVYVITCIDARSLPKISTMLGGSLGWLDTHINEGYLYAFFSLLCVATFTENANKEKLTGVQRLMMLGTFAFVWLLVMTAMLLDYTPRDAIAIQGIQGRYALPILPLLLIGINNKKIRIVGEFHSNIPAITAFFHFMVIMNILQTTCTR